MDPAVAREQNRIFYLQVFADYAIQIMACEALGIVLPFPVELHYAAFTEIFA